MPKLEYTSFGNGTLETWLDWVVDFNALATEFRYNKEITITYHGVVNIPEIRSIKNLRNTNEI